MTPELSTHLSEEALDDVLIGLGSDQALGHLTRCPECRSKVGAFRSDIAHFNEATLAWSENRPQCAPAMRSTVTTFQFPFVATGWTAVFALLVVLAIPMWNRFHPTPSNFLAVTPQITDDSEAQIAHDNDLLQAVNAAVNPPDESPVEQYHLSESPHLRHRARSK